jgi:hypothetical protein
VICGEPQDPADYNDEEICPECLECLDPADEEEA